MPIRTLALSVKCALFFINSAVFMTVNKNNYWEILCRELFEEQQVIGCFPEITKPSSGGERDTRFEGWRSYCLLLMTVWFLLFLDNRQHIDTTFHTLS